MNKKILFSPVSQHDPISYRYFNDGPMLHLCRKFMPDKIYIYCSKQYKNKINNEGDIYLEAINHLYKTKNKEFVQNKMYKLIEGNDINCADYEQITKEFINVFNYHINLDKNDELILNCSSGTPQMNAALLILKYTNKIPYNNSAYVVSNRNPNHQKENDYPINAYIKMNIDNDKSDISNIKEVSLDKILNSKDLKE